MVNVEHPKQSQSPYRWLLCLVIGLLGCFYLSRQSSIQWLSVDLSVVGYRYSKAAPRRPQQTESIKATSLSTTSASVLHVRWSFASTDVNTVTSRELPTTVAGPKSDESDIFGTAGVDMLLAPSDESGKATRRLQGGRNRTQAVSHRRHHDIAKSSPFSYFLPHNKKKDTNATIRVNWHWNIGKEDGTLKIPSKPLASGKPYRLVVDIGLEEGSGIMCDLFFEPDLVLIGIEGHLINFAISYRNMLPLNYQHLNYQERLLLLPLGISNVTGTIQFNENVSPACGSILKSKPSAWWCAQTYNTFDMPVARMDSILSLVPPNYEFYYMKVDIEGADHLAIYGAGDYINKFEMVSIECRPTNDTGGDGSRFDVCHQKTMIDYMLQRGFKGSACDWEDCHFTKLNTTQAMSKVKEIFRKTHGGVTKVEKCPQPNQRDRIRRRLHSAILEDEFS